MSHSRLPYALISFDGFSCPQSQLSHRIINSTTQLDGLFLLVNAVRQDTKKGKNLKALCSICRFQTARCSSASPHPPCSSGAAVSLCLTMFNVSALTCVLLLFLLCRDLFHSLQPSITAHGSARRNYLFMELLDGQEAPIRCIMQHGWIAMSEGFVLEQWLPGWSFSTVNPLWIPEKSSLYFSGWKKRNDDSLHGREELIVSLKIRYNELKWPVLPAVQNCMTKLNVWF